MKRGLGLGLGLLMTALAACAAPVEEGGANANDRTSLGGTGEPLLTGVMEIAPSGKFAVMQRNTVTVVLDVEGKTYLELPQQLARVVLSKTRDVAYALYPDNTLVALDLAAGSKELWHSPTPFNDISLLRVTADDTSLLLVDGTAAIAIDPATGAERGRAKLTIGAGYATFLPDGKNALIVGHTTFVAHKPKTPVTRFDLTTAAASAVDVPNCEAPISILPDGSRALLSPTFCEEARDSSTPDDAWTNPDPVSIIDITPAALTFVKNLPGFGPVALSADGSRAVAYLDMERIDRSMFSDPKQIPDASAPQYHLMVIDPKTLAFNLDPIGGALPRFAMTLDGKGLLVDSSVKVIHRAAAQANASFSFKPNSISSQGGVSASVFDENTPFGYFDLATGHFTGFVGPQAGLDRFVQLGDGKTVITLEKRKDGLGGLPSRIDTAAKKTVVLPGDYGTGVRDIGLLPDGKTMLLRLRQPAAQVGNQLFSRESYCYSVDAKNCTSGRVEYQAKVAFATVESNDCPAMGHDCW